MMMQRCSPVAACWLRWCSVFTVLAAVPLLTLGAFVTSMGVGMADQRALVNPVQAIHEFSAGDQSVGWKVEHSHRLAGWLLGMGGIVVAVGAWWSVSRPSAKWLATLGLVLIIVQGLLGIFRVRLNAWWGQELAWIHGCFAQIVFAVLVSVAVVLSSAWARSAASLSGPRLRWWSLLSVAVVFLQLVLGGMIRHMSNVVTARLHLINAFAVLAVLVWLAKLAWDEKEEFRAPIYLLMGLMVLQILLGVEAWFPWMQRVLDPTLGIREGVAILWVRSLHYLLGAMIFADVVVISLKAHRGLTVVARPVALPTGGLEGTA
jgi:heme A synthase